MVPDYIPDKVIIDTKIMVDQPVTHTGNILPGSIRKITQDLLRDVFDRFPNDLQTADDSAFLDGIGQKNFIRNSCRSVSR